MLERLDASFDGQRHFAANASHELRTPLATNRTLLEVAVAQHRVPPELRQVIDSVLAASARSELILDGLLTLARCENQAIDRLPVDLSDVAAGAMEETAGEAAAVGGDHPAGFRARLGRARGKQLRAARPGRAGRRLQGQCQQLPSAYTGRR
jgi:signal transduction histidine kinase